ncbi:hypothetical protein [Mycolicibacterium duvalii]|nr:hypothetical protein [Mycolicibacterium duvalii]
MAVVADLTAPTARGYLVLAAETGAWAGPLPVPSGRRRRLTRQLGALCEQLRRNEDVTEVTAFRAALRPPGEGTALLHRAGVRPARYDVVVLVETRNVDAVEAVRTSRPYRDLADTMSRHARHLYRLAAANAARIADVDHTYDRWFLFNYFHGDDTEGVYRIWEYTAGWFQHRTDLPDSTLLRPLDGEPADYRLVNHASWPAVRTFLPSLLFRPSFRSFVLANFRANGIAAQPIIYRRVWSSASSPSAPPRGRSAARRTASAGSAPPARR